jgi:hypothetical protein
VPSEIKVFIEYHMGPQSFEARSTLLLVGHESFGELLLFFDILHRYFLSNLHCLCFLQN